MMHVPVVASRFGGCCIGLSYFYDTCLCMCSGNKVIRCLTLLRPLAPLTITASLVRAVVGDSFHLTVAGHLAPVWPCPMRAEILTQLLTLQQLDCLGPLQNTLLLCGPPAICVQRSWHSSCRCSSWTA